MAAPPQRPLALTILLVFLLLIFAFAAWDCIEAERMVFAAIWGTFAAFLLIVLLHSRKTDESDYQRAIETYRETRMCTRCGTFYTV